MSHTVQTFERYGSYFYSHRFRLISRRKDLVSEELLFTNTLLGDSAFESGLKMAFHLNLTHTSSQILAPFAEVVAKQYNHIILHYV